ncbi:hypothetical protein DM01DRAFT_1334590 [Hesseltinella vesiculosa]|uniref:Uncharacterized protein n=1 Tax=Hesseltinella vesiculosa TaxID=101127 RepID=A0A1X2GM74_9FUNG|nr:hypothetical protein DM01DRAFT_1334590 [Hesseltinella vesiculosa]
MTTPAVTITRSSPTRCVACRYPCQQVWLESDVFTAPGPARANRWFNFFSDCQPPVENMKHVRVVGNGVQIHFDSPQAAFRFVNTPDLWAGFNSIDGHPVHVMTAMVRSKAVNYHVEEHHMDGRTRFPCQHPENVPPVSSPLPADDLQDRIRRPSPGYRYQLPF